MTLARRLALVVLALAPVSVALAQPKPALVQDRDEPGRAPYQEIIQQIAGGFCNGNVPCCTVNRCTFSSAAVPAGKRLVVTHVAVRFRQTGASIPAAFLNLVPLGVMQRTGNLVLLSMPVTVYFEADSSPKIDVFADSVELGEFFSAAVIGHFVTLP
jgi:hypothetical protein